MRRTVDVIVIFIVIISIFSMILLKEGIGVFGPTGQVVKDLEGSRTVLYPNTHFTFRYCLSTEPGVIEVGIVDKTDKYELVEKIELYDTYDRYGNPHYTYECDRGIVYQIEN